MRKGNMLTICVLSAAEQEYGLSDSSEEDEGTFVNSQVAKAKAKKNKVSILVISPYVSFLLFKVLAHECVSS